MASSSEIASPAAAEAGPGLRLAATAGASAAGRDRAGRATARRRRRDAAASSELPRDLARRLARARPRSPARPPRNREDLRERLHPGRRHGRRRSAGRILPKAEVVDEAAACLRLLSGRAHRVYTSVCLVTPKDAIRERMVETRVRFKRLSTRGDRALSRLGRMARQGRRLRHPGACRHLRRSSSSAPIPTWSGLPLYETVALLDGEGYPVRFSWLNARLTDRRMIRGAAPESGQRERSGDPGGPARSAASLPTIAYRPFCSKRCADVDLDRWLPAATRFRPSRTTRSRTTSDLPEASAGRFPQSCCAAQRWTGPGSDYTTRPPTQRLHRAAVSAQVAQLVEHATENRSVGGSIPPLGTN